MIAPGVVLSAAHCAGNYVGSSVIVGGYQSGQVTGNAEQVNVLEEAIHPNYSSSTLANDIMLLRLEETVSMSYTNIKLSVNEDSFLPPNGQDLTVLGLGALSEGGPQSGVLMDVTVPVVSTAECNDASSYNGGVIDDVMFCAGVEEGGKDSCQGDSGGPIVIRNGDQHIQVGVVSWGYGCARPDLPGVYARVSSAMPFIKSKVCDEWNLQADFCDGGGQGVCTNGDNYNAGYGTCDTYSPGAVNHGWCSIDTDSSGLVAEDACSECGKCLGLTTEATGTCTGGDNYNAGYGTCDTYSQGAINHGWCSIDTDSSGLVAEDACSECGKCLDLPTCTGGDNYNAGYGTCDTYSPGAINYDWCSLDVNTFGIVAEDACPECGKCGV